MNRFRATYEGEKMGDTNPFKYKYNVNIERGKLVFILQNCLKNLYV